MHNYYSYDSAFHSMPQGLALLHSYAEWRKSAISKLWGVGLHQVLTDIEMLAHTDFFVGSYNSGMVGLIEILRFALYGKARYTFVDASVQHRDWSSAIRRFIKSNSHLLL